jgi:hypothetical protein
MQPNTSTPHQIMTLTSQGQEVRICGDRLQWISTLVSNGYIEVTPFPTAGSEVVSVTLTSEGQTFLDWLNQCEQR